MSIQILFVAVFTLVVVHTWRRAQQGVIRRIDAIGWSIFWIMATIVVLRPETASTLANVVGVGRGVDLAVYVSVLVLFLLVFHLHILHDRMERTMTEFIRHDALRDLPRAKLHFEELKASGSDAALTEV